MAYTLTPIRDNSYQIRFYPEGIDTSTKPPYENHTVLQPIGDGGCEITGFSHHVTMENRRDTADAARELGFTYMYYERIKGDRVIPIKVRL